MKSSPAVVAAALLLAFPSGSLGYTWNFKSTPTQCGQLTIAISGQGKPPYSVLLLPSGSTPFSNGTEIRTIVEEKSSGDSSEITFQLKYPADSQFVAVVSDSTGFGSGGTSAAAQVTSSSDTSCYDASKSVQPDWFFNLDPPNQIVQCQSLRLWWDRSQVQGNVSFLGVIPGGNSFKIPQTQDTTDETGKGTGFNWTPNARAGTLMNIVASDGRRTGNGGSYRATVGENINRDNSCLNDQSPSSTAGNPAGGSYPTDRNGNGTNGGGGGGGSTNVGAIVGGVVGGVFALIALALVLWFLRRRSQDRRRTHEKPVDLLNADEGDESNRRQELPQYYEPEPFLMPDPTAAGSDTDYTSEGRPLSANFSERPSSRSGTPDLPSTSVGTRKTAPRQYRAVNIIQHDDAGPSESKPPGTEEPETIELPPAYTNLRQ